MMDVEKFMDRLNELYLPPAHEFTMVDVPEIRYAVIDGEGSPESEIFEHAKKWLYSTVHVLRPVVKERMAKRYAEPPLEYLFWAEDPQDFRDGRMERWKWRVMVVMVDWITDAEFHAAASVVEERLGPAPGTPRLETLQEGTSVQIMHIGDYSAVPSICERLYHEYLPTHNLQPTGCYHEIYLNDPSRTAPEKRRIVIRQPVIPPGT